MSDQPWLESDEEFEGVGAHRDNPRFDVETAERDAAALVDREETPEETERNRKLMEQ